MSQELVDKLTGPSKARLQAAKTIGRERVVACGPSLFDALERELERPKAWKLQSTMIDSLGRIGFAPASERLWSLCARREDDLVSMCAAEAYVRVARAGLDDVVPVHALFDLGHYSALYGATQAVANDGMSFGALVNDQLVARLVDLAPAKVRGMMDVRHGLARACGTWPPSPTTRKFLMVCASVEGDAVLSGAATKSLEALKQGPASR